MSRQEFSAALPAAFAARFDGMKVETTWNVFGLAYVTQPSEEGREFTPEQIAFIAGFEAGWLGGRAS